MPGRGPAPKAAAARINKHLAVRGEITVAIGIGWQHGKRPVVPTGLMPASRSAWSVWMGAWFAAFWTPDDVPGLRQVIRLYDQVERGEFQRAGELRLQMDTYGITPKGQQDRRWRPPVKAPETAGQMSAATGTYGHLRSVTDAVARKRKR